MVYGEAVRPNDCGRPPVVPGQNLIMVGGVEDRRQLQLPRVTHPANTLCLGFSVGERRQQEDGQLALTSNTTSGSVSVNFSQLLSQAEVLSRVRWKIGNQWRVGALARISPSSSVIARP